MTRVNDVRHVLVGLRGFLHDELGGGDSDGNPLLFESIQNLGVVQIPAGFGPR